MEWERLQPETVPKRSVLENCAVARCAYLYDRGGIWLPALKVPCTLSLPPSFAKGLTWLSSKQLDSQ